MTPCESSKWRKKGDRTPKGRVLPPFFPGALIGIEAGHLDRLVERVVNRVPDPTVNEIIVDEILGFLREVVEARRQGLRCANQPPAPERAGATAGIGTRASSAEEEASEDATSGELKKR